MKTNIAAILLAGDTEGHAEQGVPMPFLPIGGKPMIVHSLEKIAALENVYLVVILCAPKNIAEMGRVLDAWGFDRMRFRVIHSGATRQKSVAMGLTATEGCDFVIIHEATRPLVSADDFARLIDAEEPNAILATPMPFAVAQTDDAADFSGLLNNSGLVSVQHPQIFEHRPLARAHKKALGKRKEYAEDAALLLDQLGVRSRVLEGSRTNIKVTCPLDAVVAQAMFDYVTAGTES